MSDSDDNTPFQSATSTQGLKLVTVAPGSVSVPDADLSQFVQQAATGKKDPYVGCVIDGRYKVDGVLGEGGMGVVYRCTHKVIGKKVAMKVLRADMARDGEVTERFLNEARSASAIGNAHIIDISDFGQLPDGSTYFVMEFLEGTPLSKAIEGGAALPVPRIVHIAMQLAEGLASAHEAGIVHRDLKPDNIFLINRGSEKDFVKILDFGIAKVSSGSGEKLTRAGQVFGTPHYMSPEQAAGAPIDHRCDIYSLGVILYELASGKVPFDADNFMGILTQHMYKAPVPMRALVPAPEDVPPGLEAIVLKCLSKRPEQRYSSMREVMTDLEKMLQGSVPDAVTEMMQRSGGFNVPADYFAKPSMPRPVPAAPGGGHQRSRGPLIAMIAGIGACVGIAVMVLVKSSASDAKPPEKEVVVVTKEVPAPQAAPTVAAAPATKEIAVGIDPIDAHVFNGEVDLGSSPVLVKVAEGEKLELSVRHDGYKTESITVDGSQPKLTVRLQKGKTAAAGAVVAGPKPTAKDPTPVDKPKPKPKPAGGGEIVNPWE